MKVGSKAYIQLLKRIYFINKAILMTGILIKLYHWETSTFEDSTTNFITMMIITIALVVMALFEFLAIFEPIHQKPNWELVYPELALDFKHPDIDQDLFSKNDELEN